MQSWSDDEHVMAKLAYFESVGKMFDRFLEQEAHGTDVREKNARILAKFDLIFDLVDQEMINS